MPVMLLRERFFRVYETIVYKECFYEVHKKRAGSLYTGYTVLMLAVSIISVLVWSISKSMPALWAIVIAIAQFAQAISTSMPFSKQLVSLKFLLPELSRLLIELDNSWLLIDIKKYDDNKILSLINDYENRFNELELKYVSSIDVDFSESKSVMDATEKMQRSYFYSRYPDTQSKGGERNET